MGTNRLTPTVAAATLSSTSVHVGNRNLSTDSKRMVVILVAKRIAKELAEKH